MVAKDKLQAAVQRLFAAMRTPAAIDVTVKRADLELLLATWLRKVEKS